jgi:hypothetical protein
MPNTLTARYVSSVRLGLLAAFIPNSLGMAASPGQALNPAPKIKMETIGKIERPPGESSRTLESDKFAYADKRIGQAKAEESARSKSDQKGAAPDAALVKQFQQLSDEYKVIKLKTAKYPPLKSSAPPELKQAQAEMSANMAAAEDLLKGRTNGSKAAVESQLQDVEKAVKRLKDILEKIKVLDKKIADLQGKFMGSISADQPTSTPHRKP